MRLEGKVALISGGARGQGAMEARIFAREGAKVVIGDLLDAEGTRVAAEIGEAGGEALYVHLDVTSEEDWTRAVGEAVSRFGKLNVLVNNAGIYRQSRVEDTTLEEWNMVMGVNSTGVFLGTKSVIPEMKKAGGGSIINISSIAGLTGGSSGSAYPASKGAVRLLTKSTAIQHAKEGIRANSIHPSGVDTPMLHEIWEISGRSREDSEGRNPLGRIATTEDVAYGALYLASDESSFVTGSELVIDGGHTAR